jgi:hypothetical protein
MELQEDDSFEWQAPFDPDKPLPWLDAEHDVGPVVLQILIDGPEKWAGRRYVPKAPPTNRTSPNRTGSRSPSSTSPRSRSARPSAGRSTGPSATRAGPSTSRSTSRPATAST